MQRSSAERVCRARSRTRSAAPPGALVPEPRFGEQEAASSNAEPALQNQAGAAPRAWHGPPGCWGLHKSLRARQVWTGFIFPVETHPSADQRRLGAQGAQIAPLSLLCQPTAIPRSKQHPALQPAPGSSGIIVLRSQQINPGAGGMLTHKLFFFPSREKKQHL